MGKAKRENQAKKAKETRKNKEQKKTVAGKPAAEDKHVGEKISFLKRLIALLKGRSKALKRKNSPVRDEYRYNITEGHMNYVFLVKQEDGKEAYYSLGFTHDDTFKGIKNMPLKNNPKKNDSPKNDDKTSHIRSGVIKGERADYSKKKAKNYQVKGDDRANMKSKIRHHKKEQKKS